MTLTRAMIAHANRVQAEELKELRAKLHEYENVIIPSWKREEEAWVKERETLEAELHAWKQKAHQRLRQVCEALKGMDDAQEELLVCQQNMIQLQLRYLRQHGDKDCNGNA